MNVHSNSLADRIVERSMEHDLSFIQGSFDVDGHTIDLAYGPIQGTDFDNINYSDWLLFDFESSKDFIPPKDANYFIIRKLNLSDKQIENMMNLVSEFLNYGFDKSFLTQKFRLMGVI